VIPARGSTGNRTPQVTVVVAVYNRTDKLRRALTSLATQTFGSFECLVVDDASTVPIEPVVAEFDDRFVYLRSDVNQGCTTARYQGYERARGTSVTVLDSDNELFPWTLERATHYLDAHRDIGGVAGLYLFDGRVRARVSGREWIMRPADFATARRPILDFVAVFRRPVAEEWLERRVEYYNFDFAAMFSFHLRHSMLFVDEVWGRYDASGDDRITNKQDPRCFSDPVKFVREFRPLVGARTCPTLDEYLAARWFALVRRGRKKEASVLADWLYERGFKLRNVFASEVVTRARRRVRVRELQVRPIERT
jgi:glycosyltransferase involved in cell wall biosynthesis